VFREKGCEFCEHLVVQEGLKLLQKYLSSGRVLIASTLLTAGITPLTIGSPSTIGVSGIVLLIGGNDIVLLIAGNGIVLSIAGNVIGWLTIWIGRWIGGMGCVLMMIGIGPSSGVGRLVVRKDLRFTAKSDAQCALVVVKSIVVMS